MSDVERAVPEEAVGPGTGGGSGDATDARPRDGLHRRVWFWAPILPLFALDLWSKGAVFAMLEERLSQSYQVFEGTINFKLVRYYNTGTVWGLAKEFTNVLVGLRFVALGVLAWMAWKSRPRERLRQAVLGMIAAGAAGNLWDNLTVGGGRAPDGGVRDFLEFYARFGDGTYVFPAFNVADSCITVGAITLAVLLWRDDGASPPSR